MPLEPCTTVFFDITSTIAFVLLSADGGSISTFTVYPGVADPLKEVRDAGARLGFIFRCGELPGDDAGRQARQEELRRRLADAGFREGDLLLVVPGDVPSDDAFRQAADLAHAADGCAGAPVLFVSGHPGEREIASQLGFLVAPHPRVAGAVLAGAPLRYVRIRAPSSRSRADWVHVLRGQQIVPIHVSTEPADGAPTAVYAITDSQTAARLDDLGFWVDRLGVPDEPQHTAAYLVRDDLQEKHGFLELVGNARTVASGPAASSVLASTHKGLLVALSSATPLDSFHFSEASEGHIRQLSPSVTLLQDGGTVAPRTTPLGAAVAADPLTPQELRIVGAHFAPATLQTIVDRYAGAATGFNTSRHVQHPGNRIAVDDLVADLGRVAGLTVQRHNFSTQQQAQLANVVATLGATSNMQDGGIVIVSAHLDSTAAKDGDAFDRATSPAPGADDDGSGMATVLEAAAAFADLAAATGRPHREVRFVLFNCEEEGKAGSDTYAKAQAALKAQISAVFHVDMIGFTEDPPTNFEVHAAFGVDDAPNRADASARTGELGALIEQLRPALTSLPLTQLITSPDEVGAGRSDHASFHAVGFPACWVTEDFFPDEPPASKLNPNYHTSKDRTIDADYAAQIARLVGAAAWIAATR